MRNHIIIFTVLMLSVSAATADQNAATACAIGLPPPARQIYDAVLATKAPVADLARTVRERTMALVQAGQIPMGAAPDNALAAARCLEFQR